MADWMAFNVADYVANTLHLTTRQHGAYILLICAAWNGKGTLPGTDEGLRAIAKLSPREWKDDGPALKAFLTRRGEMWIHERVEFEWNDAQSLIAAKSKAGREGARRRWEGRGNGKPMAQPLADGSQPQRQNDAPLPLPIPVTTTPSVANSAPVGASQPAKSQLLTEKWEPSEADKAAILKEVPHLAPIYEQRMADFRDWCVANATRTFNPAATWRGFMRKTQMPKAARSFDAKPHVVADDNWPWRMAKWREDKFWPSSWGPEPGAPGCFVPREFLQ